jgi:hypothetical protein
MPDVCAFHSSVLHPPNSYTLTQIKTKSRANLPSLTHKADWQRCTWAALE